MEDDDIVRVENLRSVRAITRRTARRVIVLSVLAGALGGGLFALLVYAFTGPSQLWLAFASAAIFTGLGLHQAINWYGHYRGIGQQLDALEDRVQSGETIYGSQVRFHSRG